MRAPDLPDVFTRAQARAAGVGDVRLAGLVRRGELIRLRPGVYAVASAPDPLARAARHVLETRAVLSQRTTGFVASHLSAGAVHALPLPLGAVERVHLTTMGATQRSRTPPAALVHHGDSTPTDLTVVDEIEVTTVARTVADCLRCWGPRVSVPIADAALHRRQVTPEEMGDQLRRMLRWGGGPRARESLRLVDGRRESWLESYAFVRLHEWQIPLPEPQILVLDSGGWFVARVDGGWVADGAVVEFDGANKYELPLADGQVDPDRAWEREKTRYDAIGNLGLQRVRFGLDDLLHRQHRVEASVRRAREAGSLSRFSGCFRSTDPTGLTCSSIAEALTPRNQQQRESGRGESDVSGGWCRPG